MYCCLYQKILLMELSIIVHVVTYLKAPMEKFLSEFSTTSLHPAETVLFPLLGKAASVS